MKYKQLEKTLKILADENRLKILHMLNKQSLCACELLEELQITQPTLSYHMKMLVMVDLVQSEKRGKWQHYWINEPKAKQVEQAVAALFLTKTS